MAIQRHAADYSSKPALVVAGEGTALSYAELNDRSARLATWLASVANDTGDRVAILMENRPEFLIAAWAVRRAGLRYVPVNWHLSPAEAAYVVENCDARVLVTSMMHETFAGEVSSASPLSPLLIVAGSRSLNGFDAILAANAPLPEGQQREGAVMPYSSGTSGRPKGILRPLADAAFGEPIPFEHLMSDIFGFDENSIYLSPAPLYHTAPLGWSMGTQALGGSVVLMEQFDAERALRAIEQHRVTHAQFVPTHFVRMLRLPQDVRDRYDLSSLKMILHSAAPCPADVKQAMIDWLGPIVHEYYAGSEGGGFVTLGSKEWLDHRGSVGRPLGNISTTKGAPGFIRIVDPESRDEKSAGEVGVIYFENVAKFEYHKDPGQTADFFTEDGWGTLGDMGWLDDDGYLYLADRKSHMIISGGVNIYPKEIEDVLTLHAAVSDVAVIGVPNDEFGEEVKAVVQPLGEGGAELAKELMEFCRDRLAGYKCPRSIDFVEQLPRLPNGKLLKRQVRDAYWPEGAVKI